MKIIWLVNDLYINNFITVYYECQQRDDIELTVVATAHLDLYGGKALTSHKVAKYLRERNVQCIDSVTEETGELLDIAKLEPDYVFMTTPYDIYYPEPYRSYYVSCYAKLCNVAYGAYVIEEVGKYAGYGDTPYKHALSFLFSGSPLESDKEIYRAVGCLKLDEYAFYSRKLVSALWDDCAERLRVLWKPRWTLDSKDSNLLRYLPEFVEYVKTNSDVDFVFLEHPLLHKTIQQAPEETVQAFYTKYEQLKKLPNFHICADDNFLDTLLSADVLIADHGSALYEAATMGVDVIYTPTEAVLNALGKKIVEKNVSADNFDEISAALQRIKRQKACHAPPKVRWPFTDELALVPPDHLSVAQYLLKILEKDYKDYSKSCQYYKANARRVTEEKIKLQEKLSWQEKELSRVYEENTEVWKKYHESEDKLRRCREQIEKRNASVYSRAIGTAVGKIKNIPGVRFLKKFL